LAVAGVVAGGSDPTSPYSRCIAPLCAVLVAGSVVCTPSNASDKQAVQHTKWKKGTSRHQLYAFPLTLRHQYAFPLMVVFLMLLNSTMRW
jgi:hypothetical protein